jgi:hypothetical protein
MVTIVTLVPFPFAQEPLRYIFLAALAFADTSELSFVEI